MSSYTMPLRTLIEQATQYQPNLTTAQMIEEGRKKLFDFDYPIFDEAYRKVFETNFIRRFYMREIGFETEGLFKFQLETWLLINMPYYNKMFESELIEFDPLENSRVDVSHTKKNDKLQNDIMDGIRDSINKEVSNVIENQTSNSTTQSDSTGSSDTVSNETTSQDSTGSSDTTSKDINAGTTSGTKVDDNFERKLKTNNPDSRLTITTNDGEGVIEYASAIDEETENNSETTTGKANSTVDRTSGTDTVDSTNGQRDSTVGMDSTDSTTSTNNLVADSTGDSTVDNTGKVTSNDTLVSNINDVEDFIQHRAGKIGIQTYSEMLLKYRNTFLRLEKRMHNEMQELFMLVY